MELCLLFNPKAGSAGPIDAIRDRLAARYHLTVIETHSGDDLRRQVADLAARRRVRAIVIAGGDGTIHAAVNALAPRFPRVRLVVIPLGTGNDLCRTLDIPLDPLAAADLLRTGRRRRIDVVRVEGEWTGHMVNAATGGFSGRVARDVTSEVKQVWGPLAYLRGAAGPIAERTAYRVVFRFDGGPPVERELINVVVANGRMAAGGVVVAPTANPEDGKLDIVMVRPSDYLDLTVVTARLMAGDYTEDELVSHRTARTVEITSEPPIPMSIDGELTEGRHFKFTTLPRVLRVLTGPGYRPDPYGRPVGPGGVRAWLFALLAGFLNGLRYTPRASWLGLAIATVIAAMFWWLSLTTLWGGRHPDDEAIRQWVEVHRTPALDVLAIGTTWLGSLPVLLPILAVTAALLVWWRRTLDAVLLTASVIGCLLFEVIVKPYFALARPDLAGALVEAHWHSFPSGHALRGVGFYGFLAVMLVRDRPEWWRWPVAALLALLALAVGVSRVYVGVHYPFDVAAGMLAAASWVVLLLAVRHAVRRYQEKFG